MPKAFDTCKRAGGKIRTRTISKTKFQRICVIPKGRKGPRGGRTVGGEIKTKKRS